MLLRCGRCGYEWDYGGKSEWYASCPRCRTTVRVGERAPDMKAVVESLRKVMPELASRYGVKRLALFGSFVRGEQGRASDVDVVVELKRPLGLEFVDLAERLERAVGRRVDLLTPAGVRSIRAPAVRKRIKEGLVYI
ncbi:MAG: nucleotidyltransferase family protein [Hadesarchaea archaeon]|nr:nucleotidyltransferase family protein [Hadesarchaea archaeon]